MKLYRKLLLIILVSVVSVTVSASDIGKFEHKIVVGYHFGATAPLPLPREVRSVNSYWPQFTPQLGYNISYRFAPDWSIESGITLDLKGMGVQDEVKYMYTDVMMGGDNIKGYFTGKNETTVKLSYVTVPLRLAYSVNETWRLRAGGYFSYRSSSEFSGTVWDGYLRKTDDEDILNSQRLNIPDKNEATFDFGKDMRNFDMGVSLGFEHDLKNRFSLYSDFTYSLTPVFPSSFTGIDMKMRNIYLVLGISYRL